MERDRLKRKLKRQALRNTIFVLLGIGILIYLLFTFGTQLLINFSLLIAPKDSTDNVTTSQGLNYLAAPDLEPIDSATNSAKINVSGTVAVDKARVKLFVNGVLAETKEVNDKNEFSFQDVSIDEGDNEIKAKTVSDEGKESNFSSPQTVTYKTKAPELTIDYPSEGQKVKDSQPTIRGKTDPGVKVTVDGFWAIVDDRGNFTYNVKLHDGDNTLKLEATDPAGNKTAKDLRVTYAP